LLFGALRLFAFPIERNLAETSSVDWLTAGDQRWSDPICPVWVNRVGLTPRLLLPVRPN